MGCGGSKTAEEHTADLWTLVTKKLKEYPTVSQVQNCLAGGAVIDRPDASGKYMVEHCLEQEKRNRQANLTAEANRCQRVAEILQQKASGLLLDAVGKGDLTRVQLLHKKLGGDLHQSGGFGVLGLLSVALRSQSASLPLVQYLVESHASNRAAIGLAVTATKPPQALHKQEGLAAPIAGYLLANLNAILLELPATVPAGQGNDGANATRLTEHAELMIQNGADPRATNAAGNNVLCQAVVSGHVPLVRKLLSLGVDSTFVNASTGQSVLQLAESLSQRDPVLIALLKAHSFNLEFQQRIVRLGEEKEVEFEVAHGELQTLLTTGADIHCLDGNQETPLHLLVRALVKLDQEDEGKFVRVFVADFHADPERMNAQGMRPIELAILMDKNLRVLGELLEHASSFKNPKSGESILAFAKRAPESEHKEAAVHLIQAALDRKLWFITGKCNKRGKGHPALLEEIKAILLLGANINANTGDDQHEGWTPLCLVASQGDAFLVRAFVQQHGSIPILAASGESSDLNTPLHLAAQAGQLASVQFLRSLAISMNVLNARKESALHLAAAQGHVRVVKFLVAWGCSPAHQNDEGLIALEVAQRASTMSPTSGSGTRASKEQAQYPLVIAFLSRCQPGEVCSEKAHIISQVDPSTIDVVPLVRLQAPADLNPVGAADEDKLGEQSRGLIKGKPNDNLKSAARKGNLADARLAVSEGADVRHMFDGKSAYEHAMQARASALKSRENQNDYNRRREYQREADSCEYVANYLVEVATTKLKEAVEQGHEGRVAAYTNVHAKLNGLVPLAATSTASVGIMHHLVSKLHSNFQALWGGGAAGCPYALAKAKKFDAVAAYIQQQLSAEAAKAVKDNNLNHLRECIVAGGLPDFEGADNIRVAIGHKNLDLCTFLLDSGARLPVYPDVRAVETDPTLTDAIRALMRQRYVDRRLRVAAALGQFDELQTAHALGADLSATNYAGATPLSLSLQYTHQPAIAHYLVSRGGSIVHKQTGVASCVPLSRAPGHPPSNALEAYLKDSLNIALFNAVMEGDLVTSAALGALGAELSSQDDAGNTLVHVAVAFAGLDAVRWLVERGAPLNIANNAGEYAITAATSKGDFGSVEFMVHQNAGTKALKNGAGKTALDIAKEHRYNKLVQLMDPGNKDFPVGENDDAPQEPSQEPEELMRAASYGQLDAIKIFIEEKYASLSRKTALCADMIKAAEKKSQAEVLRILVPHYKSLTSEAQSDQTADRLVSASAEQRAVLAGFLTGLTGLIAGGEVALDPNDPATYQQLFTNLTNKVGAQTEFLAKNAGNPAELGKAVGRESAELAQKMAKIESELKAMGESRTAMQKRLQAQEAQLAASKTALQKKDCYKEIQEVKDQMRTLASSVSLFSRAQEAAQKKKKTIDALKSQPNLLACYGTIENRLQGLFLACKTATAGMMSLNMTEQGDRRMTLVNVAADLSEMIPIIGATLSKVISVGVGTLVTHLDKARQQQEIANICTLGNIEELEKAASNAAALTTFYYSAQINAVMSTGEKKAEDFVPALGEYLVCMMIKSLQRGDVVPGMDLATQMWFSVVSQDPLKPQSLVDRLLGTPGDVQVKLKADGQKVTLRALIGSVGVIDGSNELLVPQQKLLNEVAKVKPGFTPYYSVAYLSAFTTVSQAQLIVERRGLVKASESEAKLFLGASVRLNAEESKTLAASVALFKEDGSELDTTGAVVPVSPSTMAEGQSHSSSQQGQLGGDVSRVSLQVHDVLSTKGLVVSRAEVSEMLQQQSAEAGVAIEADVDSLREDLNAKHALYQASIDAATETLTTESEKLRAEHRTVGVELRANVAKQLADQAAQFAKAQAQQNRIQEEKLAEVLNRAQAHVAALEKQSSEAMANMQKQHADAVAKLQADAAAALQKQAEAQAAAIAKLVATSEAASAAAAASKATSEQASAAAADTLSKATQAREQWAADLAASKAGYDAALKTSTDASAKAVADYKASLDGMKSDAKTAAAGAKESAAAAATTAKEAKEFRELQAKELAMQKDMREKEIKALKEAAAAESKALLAQAKDAQQEATKAADASRNAEKLAKKAQSEAEDAKDRVIKAEASIAKKTSA